MSTATILDLAKLSLALGEEERVTTHPDGRLESVATHSHMLLLVACTVAATHNYSTTMDAPRGHVYDVGLVAQFAAVHDVPEVAPGGPGDVDTFLTTEPDALAAKEYAEDGAVERLVAVHPTWLGPLVARYRAQLEPEARLVRYLDKVMPKATLALSGCAQFDRDEVSREYFDDFVAKQRAELDATYPELVDICGGIYENMNTAVRAAWEER